MLILANDRVSALREMIACTAVCLITSAILANGIDTIIRPTRHMTLKALYSGGEMRRMVARDGTRLFGLIQSLVAGYFLVRAVSAIVEAPWVIGSPR
jgi:hypothetical protein